MNLLSVTCNRLLVPVSQYTDHIQVTIPPPVTVPGRGSQFWAAALTNLTIRTGRDDKSMCYRVHVIYNKVKLLSNSNTFQQP